MRGHVGGVTLLSVGPIAKWRRTRVAGPSRSRGSILRARLGHGFSAAATGHPATLARSRHY